MNYYGTSYWAPTDSLSHHGILGQKWGRKNGPPYPLGSSDHSASEKKAGWRKSLSEKREKKKPLLERAFEKNIAKQVKKESEIRRSVAGDQKLKENIEKELSEHKDEVNDIRSMAQNVIDKANIVNKNLEKDLSKVKIDAHTKELLWTALEKDFGGKDQIDDKEFFESIVEEYVDAALLSHIYQRKDVKDYLDLQSKYWDKVELFADSIADKYASTASHAQIVRQTAKSRVRDGLDTQFMGYLARHFDDYWIMDTDAYRDAVNRLSKDFTIDKWPNT